jgi:hypothetical protein
MVVTDLRSVRSRRSSARGADATPFQIEDATRLMPLPVRVGPRGERPAVGPRPFSQEWLATPEEERLPPPRRLPELPLWIPSERVLTATLVMLLVLMTAIASGAPAPKTTAGLAAPTLVSEPPQAANVVPTPTATISVGASVVETNKPTPEPTDTAVSSPVDSATVSTQQAAGAILPDYRILSYYGHPHNDQMGILGEFDKDELLTQLQDEVAAYDEADPSRPVMPAFELIVSVAQNWPADDGTYLLHTDADTIQEYVDFTREHNMLLILDLQIGHSTVENEISRVNEWLLEPHVHLALDPEFAMDEGEIPGEAIGSLDASDVATAQEELANIVAENNLPPKVLIVHRFTEGMITNAEQIPSVAGVQTVIDFDGHGDPANKMAGYGLLLVDGPAEFAGFKLFYNEDQPSLMNPEEVVNLPRPPDVVIYQ